MLSGSARESGVHVLVNHFGQMMAGDCKLDSVAWELPFSPMFLFIID